MIEQRSQELVVGCVAASAAVAAGSSLASGNVPGLRMVVGVAATGAGLATVSMLAPDLAGAFAVLILTTTVFVYGGPLMEAISAATGGPTHAPRTTTPSTPSKKGSVAV